MHALQKLHKYCRGTDERFEVACGSSATTRKDDEITVWLLLLLLFDMSALKVLIIGGSGQVNLRSLSALSASLIQSI